MTKAHKLSVLTLLNAYKVLAWKYIISTLHYASALLDGHRARQSSSLQRVEFAHFLAQVLASERKWHHA